MGSSKKHKEKDKDRDREKRRDRERKHRERDSNKDRDKDSDKERRRTDDRAKEKRSHPAAEDGESVEKKRAKREEYDDLYEYAVEESTRDDHSNDNDMSRNHQEGGEISLSIEETNKLRIKLGLKPLEIPDSSADTEGKTTSSKEDVHVPATNISDQKETENFKRKLEEMREKRRINKKLGKVKSLGAADSDDDDSAASWVAKSRKKENEKSLAEKRAKLLAEMDEEFGISDLVEEEVGSLTRPTRQAYSSRDLRGLKVAHSQEHFTEGSSVIMTLKDASVRDDDVEETLINVNIVDKELRFCSHFLFFPQGNKNVELRKKKPDYRPYDEPEMDEYGMVKARGVLDKYDEEIEGEQEQSFVLGSEGTYDTSKEDEVKK
ncbi:unnamed protein product, partial [Porites lobata]